MQTERDMEEFIALYDGAKTNKERKAVLDEVKALFGRDAGLKLIRARYDAQKGRVGYSLPTTDAEYWPSQEEING